MGRTRAYRREARRKSIARKKRVSCAVYGCDWFRIDGKYSKGHIGCGCGLCKDRWEPLLYEVKDQEYVRQSIREAEYAL